jgi:hypothetical protein
VAVGRTQARAEAGGRWGWVEVHGSDRIGGGRKKGDVGMNLADATSFVGGCSMHALTAHSVVSLRQYIDPYSRSKQVVKPNLSASPSPISSDMALLSEPESNIPTSPDLVS